MVILSRLRQPSCLKNAGHTFHFMYCYRFITRDWIIHELKCKNWRQEEKNWYWHVNIDGSISYCIKRNTQQHFLLPLTVFFYSSWTYSNVWTGSALVIYDVPLITDAGQQKQHLIPWWQLVIKEWARNECLWPCLKMQQLSGFISET